MTEKVYEWQPTTSAIAARYGLSPTDVIRFDHNTSPLAPSLDRPELELIGLNEYPEADYRPLREAIARYRGVRLENVVPGAGADELISVCTLAFAEPGDAVAAAVPTYPLYEIAAHQRRAEFVAIKRNPRDGWTFDPDEIADSSYAIVWLCVPNNPTGNRDPGDAIRRVVENSSGAVIIDAAYAEFAGDEWGPWIDRYHNLIVLGTLSKAFGLAGLRVGYALAGSANASRLESFRPPGSVSAVSAGLAQQAFANPSWAAENVAMLSSERERMCKGLEDLGLYPLATATNFVPVEVGTARAERLEANLMSEGLVVRIYRDPHPLAGFLRFTVRSPAENDRLLAALERNLA